MSLQRAPWWMYVVAASFLAYFAMVDYTFWSGLSPWASSNRIRPAGVVLVTCF